MKYAIKEKFSARDCKIVVISVVLTILIGFFFKNVFTSSVTSTVEKHNAYCHEINRIIKDIDFDKGSVADGEIRLYNDGEEVYCGAYDKFDSKYKIEYIRKAGHKVFFVLNAIVDDEDGIVFQNGDSEEIMEGLWSLERIGGDSFYYKTYK